MQREFRGMWIATVANIDWPTQRGLPALQQQTELVTLLDLARALNFTAVILQIRAAGDAMYASPFEPWSRSLSGTQGTNPGYDPLQFAVDEAHKRGLELHAWFNPFRAGNASDSVRFHSSHFARVRPDLARLVGSQIWFDPGESDVQDQTMRVVLDVVRRYDIDGVHLDDFFYPYPSASWPRPSAFPDSAAYARYLQSAGPTPLGRDDWRRDNINRFVERMYREVKLAKPHAKVGISPFGIWRPGSPPGITGLDAYADIYADSRLWLQRGWVDYLAPQLYWSIASTGQSFPALLDWWLLQNTPRRHLWPGLAAYRVADGTASAYPAGEIGNQVALVRARATTSSSSTAGALLYNATSIRVNRGGLSVLLQSDSYRDFALAPSYPWIDATPPVAPTITAQAGSSVVLRFSLAAETPMWWLIRQRRNNAWSSSLVPATASTFSVPTGSSAPDAVAVAAVDRAGNMSPYALWK
ncbi:MAG: glycoside hydrolase family 10 protein [Gemmatimonadaceae bacterium]